MPEIQQVPDSKTLNALIEEFPNTAAVVILMPIDQPDDPTGLTMQLLSNAAKDPIEMLVVLEGATSYVREHLKADGLTDSQIERKMNKIAGFTE